MFGSKLGTSYKKRRHSKLEKSDTIEYQIGFGQSFRKYGLRNLGPGQTSSIIVVRSVLLERTTELIPKSTFGKMVKTSSKSGSIGWDQS